jgi:hypothetical protein
VRSWLKNIFLTALMVIGATMATAAVAAMVTLLIASREATTPVDSNLLVYGGMFAVMLAAVVGLFFSFATLFVAGVTMPPAIGLMRWLKLPRPLFDIFGGGAAGLLCAAMAASTLESIARAKGGGLGDGGDDVRLVLDMSAMFVGAALGYVRHAVLAPKAEKPASTLEPQMAG